MVSRPPPPPPLLQPPTHSLWDSPGPFPWSTSFFPKPFVVQSLILGERVKVKVAHSCPTLCPWNSPGQITGVGSYLHQGIFPTQGSNPGLLHCRRILHRLNYQKSPHPRGLEYKSRKSRDTCINRQAWPWRTKWSRAKANRLLPKHF